MPLYIASGIVAVLKTCVFIIMVYYTIPFLQKYNDAVIVVFWFLVFHLIWIGYYGISKKLEVSNE